MHGFWFEAVVYGHAAAGCLHVRPLVASLSPDVAERLLRALQAVSELVTSYDGAITGEHGWGLARSHLVADAVGPELYARMVAVKRAWDPDGILNPGRIVDAKPPDPASLVG